MGWQLTQQELHAIASWSESARAAHASAGLRNLKPENQRALSGMLKAFHVTVFVPVLGQLVQAVEAAQRPNSGGGFLAPSSSIHPRTQTSPLLDRTRRGHRRSIHPLLPHSDSSCPVRPVQDPDARAAQHAIRELRKNGIILFGILPCAFGSVAIQLVSLAVYMARVKSIEAGGNRADKAFTRAAGEVDRLRATRSVGRRRRTSRRSHKRTIPSAVGPRPPAPRRPRAIRSRVARIRLVRRRTTPSAVERLVPAPRRPRTTLSRVARIRLVRPRTTPSLDF